MIGGTPHPELAAAYRECRQIAAAHGRTYFLATRLLSAERRPAVHALYAFARVVDDIVDHAEIDVAQRYPSQVRELPEHGRGGALDPGGTLAPSPGDELDLIEKQLRIALETRETIDATWPLGVSLESREATNAAQPLGVSPMAQKLTDATGVLGISPEPSRSSMSAAPLRRPAPEAASQYRRGLVLLAVADTIRRYNIAAQHFWTFLDSMRMDAPGTPRFRDRYATMADLHEYMSGSAAAIGLQVLPVLGTVVPIAEAEPAAAALGEAFQLTNFLRDVAEDLDRDRVYLPADELAAFGVDHDLLAHCHRTQRTDPRVRRALTHLIALNRDIYRHAEPGIDLLEPRVRPAIRTAAMLYASILNRIEDSGYAIFSHRAVVPGHQRLGVAAMQFTTAALRPRWKQPPPRRVKWSLVDLYEQPFDSPR
ncbi:phytoene/squalene synthase family protein [Nocardia sp. NPDC046473]|uniref:phytoene/squalene synthase family protein n=1 Tax=Nocardia sp. NPDC046473 TaxID=3155733 RepID=UPI0033FEF237